jgi:hypothetical protein
VRKTQLQRRLCGRTKPGTLLKHDIPIKTDALKEGQEKTHYTPPGNTELILMQCNFAAGKKFDYENQYIFGSIRRTENCAR